MDTMDTRDQPQPLSPLVPPVLPHPSGIDRGLVSTLAEESETSQRETQNYIRDNANVSVGKVIGQAILTLFSRGEP